MTWLELSKESARAISRPFVEIGGTPISSATALTALGIVFATFAASALTQRALHRVLLMRGFTTQGTAGILTRFLHYVFIIVGLSIALETVGISLRTLFAASAVFAVGLGLAMQHITQSFIGGVILMAERSIKPGDILEVQGEVVQVKHLGVRATVVESLDGEALIIPNAILIQSTVKNFTLRHPAVRMRAQMRIRYTADLGAAQALLQECVDHFESGIIDPPPRVVLLELGESYALFEARVWIIEPWREAEIKSRLLHTAWQRLSDGGFTLAQPQLEVQLANSTLAEAEPPKITLSSPGAQSN